MDISQDIQEDILPPFRKLLEGCKNIKIHPYYTGPFEVFEEGRSSDVVWDLAPLLRVMHEYSQCGKQVLEIGCGSGRVTFYLAEQGFEVLGVDSSQDSLARLDKCLESQPDLVPKIRTIHADFLSETYNIEGKFDMVVLANLSINSFWKEESAVALLKRVKTLLKPDGAFCFGIFADDTVQNFTMYKGQVITATYKDGDGIQRIMWVAIKFELESQIRLQTSFLEALPTEKKEVLGHLSVIKERVWSLSTFMPLLQSAGFSITDKVECTIEGGGGHGWPLFMVAAQPTFN